jgi:hypothetical protein
VSRGSVAAGQQAENILNGYMQLGLHGKNYFIHRLAWFYVYGYFPEGDIDHINRERADNRIANLREVSRSCNVKNAPVRKDCKSGIRGVVCMPVGRKKKWHARICVNKKIILLGYYKTKLEAALARWEAEKKHNWPDCDTTSSALAYIKEVSP